MRNQQQLEKELWRPLGAITLVFIEGQSGPVSRVAHLAFICQRTRGELVPRFHLQDVIIQHRYMNRISESIERRRINWKAVFLKDHPAVLSPFFYAEGEGYVEDE